MVDTLWTIEDLYNAVMKQQAEKKHRARVEKVLRKLGSLDKPPDQLESGPAVINCQPFLFWRCKMDENQKAERAAKSSIIDRIRLLTFEDDLEGVKRDNRTERMYEMDLNELQVLQERLSEADKKTMVGVLVEEISKSEHKRAGIA
jgi:hypothetical protein